MALKVSPQRLREVRFAEQWRGYRTDEVDDFVDQVAEAISALELRVREATERAVRAEQALHEQRPDEHVSRTLVLAQRTADAALAEAEVEANRLVDEATRRAEALMREAEERASGQRREIEQRAASELEDLAERRSALEADVALLARYVQGQRAALAEELRIHLRWLETADHLPPPPVTGPWTTPVSVPAASNDEGSSLEGPLARPGGEELEESASQAEALRQGSPPPSAGPGDGPVEVVPADAETRASAPAASAERRPEQGKEPAAADLGQQIPWRRPEEEQGEHHPPQRSLSTDGDDDDPFIAELRRAVDDPEPLGPRDDDDEWVDDASLGSPEDVPLGRRRRRRQR